MKYKYFLIILLLVFTALLPRTASAMSLRTSDADIRYILTSLAANGGINIALGDDVSGTVSVNLYDVTPVEAIKIVARIKGLALEEENNVVYIGTQQNMHSHSGSLHMFRLQYADPDTLAGAVRLSFSKNASAGNSLPDSTGKNKADDHTASEPYDIVFTDKELNALFFYGTDSEARKVASFIKSMDIPVRQVMLEAKVIALQKDASKKLGIEWEWSQLPQYPEYERSYDSVRRRIKNDDGTYTSVTEDIPINKVTRHYNGTGSIPGIIQFGRGPEGIPFEFYYGATLNALITDGKATVLAKPNIMALNSHEAVINIGGSVPIPRTSITDSTSTTSFEYHDVGIILRYTPLINDSGDITASVHTEVSSPLYVEELKAYRFQTRSADTTVRLKDGETMIIGGLIGSEESKSMSKIPFLGDLPVLGNFFRSIKKSKSESEIIIFLTAHVKNDDKPDFSDVQK